MGLLRDEGLDAVSMRRVADRLGVAPNSIYAHVADKAALVDELIDAMLGGVPTPTDDGWRERIERVMRDSRRELLAHPDLVPFALVRQSVGPNALRLGEVTLTSLREAGLDGAEAVTGSRCCSCTRSARRRSRPAARRTPNQRRGVAVAANARRTSAE